MNGARTIALLLLAGAGCRRGGARDEGAPRPAHVGGVGASAAVDAAGPARPAIAGEPAGGDAGSGAWEGAVYARLFAARAQFDACGGGGGARRGRIASLSSALEPACACRVVCGLRFDPPPAGANARGLRVPLAGVEGVRFDVGADGAVASCDAAGSAAQPEATHVTCNGRGAE